MDHQAAAQSGKISMSDAATGYDRFAHWPRGLARAGFAVFLALLALSAIVPITRGEGHHLVPHFLHPGDGPAKVRDDDLTVYDSVIVRLQRGESYYPAVVAEHRRIGFPLTPGLAVRLPTLAWIDAAIGTDGEQLVAIALLAATMAVWWQRLGGEPGAQDRRLLAFALLMVNAVLVLNTYFFRLHELFAGMLLAIAFGLHRPGRWGWALAAAALALAIRELALPFVVLMAAMAMWRRDWKEGGAWCALATVFLIGLAVHLHIVAGYVQPGDYVSKSWFALRGFSGWLSDFVLIGSLRYLPHWITGPVVVLTMLGWTGWRSHTGTFGTLLLLGYGMGFMIAGRFENYYWAAMVAPTMFVGLAFAPMALKSLWRAAALR